MMMNDILGVGVNIMEELGLTREKRDANGNLDYRKLIGSIQLQLHSENAIFT